MLLGITHLPAWQTARRILAWRCSAVQESIKSAGGEIHSAVKRGTSYLVIGEKVGQRKIEKAEALGTTVIDEQALARMLEESGDG